VIANHISSPLLISVKIKYEDGLCEWISGDKLIDSIDMIQKAINIIVD
jgi:hypothetical protein